MFSEDNSIVRSMTTSLRIALMLGALSVAALAQAGGEALVRCYNLADSRKVCLYEDAWLQQHKDDYWGSGRELVDDKQQKLGFASLRILDANNQRIAALRVRPLADISRTKLSAAGQPVFLLTEDLSAGWGSYSGPLSRPFTVGKSGFVFVQPEGAPGKEFGMLRSLKVSWREARDGFLLLTCRLDDSFDDFIITYARVQLVGNQWVYTEKRVKGFWDVESPFPNEKLFPPRAK